ncbi:hypothetical protein HPP92_012662 [Vanilla planifolia]|uniref:Xylanase inhibitor N-terminal domain-containing protein n=1 Tax=Vanilla planifolia TaxID=51239 RepID=A0A835QU67_VANPL|nr:hypothetical protein HPP92_012662 [Vanilla planifolia]
MILDGCITHGLMLALQIFHSWLHWMLEVIYFGFLVIAFGVPLYQATVVGWTRSWPCIIQMNQKQANIFFAVMNSALFGGSCRTPNQPCPYIVNYYSENTSTSGWLLEDMLYLIKTEDHVSLQATVIVGCGRKQSGGYLDGIAPDGVLGLGFGEISVPSMLARVGLVRNSFLFALEVMDLVDCSLAIKEVPLSILLPVYSLRWEIHHIYC